MSARLVMILLGPVHRLVWTDVSPERDREERAAEQRARSHRRRALDRLKETLQALSIGKEPERRVAVLADWWMQAALGVSPLGTAWRVDEELPSWLGRPLRAALDVAGRSPALVELHQPLAFRRARARLKEQADHHQTIKKSPGPEIYKEAQKEAYELLRLSEDPSRPPPTGLRILNADVEEWASEPRNDEDLIPQSSVWNNLVKHLRLFQDKAHAVVRHWTAAPPSAPLLPADAMVRIETELAPYGEMGRTLLFDVVRLTQEERTPDALRPAWLMEQLVSLPSEVTLPDRVRLLALAQEARDADPALTPAPWIEDAEAELTRIANEISALESRAGSQDTKTWITEARSHLENLDAAQAAEFLQIASAEIEGTERELERTRLVSELRAWTDDLKSAGQVIPEQLEELTLDALRPLHKGAETTRTLRAKETAGRLDELSLEVARLALGEDRARLEAALRDARGSLRDGSILKSHQLSSAIAAELLGARQREEETLGPELVAIAERARKAPLRGPESSSIESLLRRIRARWLAKLPNQHLIDGLLRLIDAIERDRADQLPLLAVAGGKRDLGAVLTPVAFMETGVAMESTRVSWTGELVLRTVADLPQGSKVRTGGQGAWYRKPPRPDMPSELRRDPESLDDSVLFRPVYAVSPSRLDEARLMPGPGPMPFFVEDGGRVLGPYSFTQTGAGPADPRGFVAALGSARFYELFGKIEIDPPCVHEAPTLDELVASGAEVVDVDDAVARERWLADMLDDLSGIDVGSLQRLLERLGAKRPLPRPILARRAKDLENVIEASRLLGRERRRAAERFLTTEEGRREIERAAAKSVETRRAEIEREAESLRQTKSAELQTLEQEIERARGELISVRGEETALRAEREERLRDLSKEISLAQELLEDKKTRLLAQLMGGSRKSVDPEPEHNGEPVAAKPCGPRSGADARAIVNRIAAQLSIEPQDAANLLASSLSGPWTLLAGPPGAGKSTLARGFLAALGHGPGTDRYLELVVRRDWQDDAALFGFFHPEQHAWIPGSEGLLDWLLRAEDDRRRAYGGLYAAVLEELNLASPEYYLSRLISALEAQDPTVRLYGEELSPSNKGRYPSSFTLGPNVRLVGTVNIDETVERLSPRFLSRASVIWVEPDLASILRAVPPSQSSADPIDYAELHDLLVPREPIPLGPIEEVVSFLHERRIPGAPATRTLVAVRRYLSASRGLLSDAVARDFAVVQRILPSFRGVGPRYGLALEDLSRLLRRHGFLRSAERCERLRQRGAELGEYYDFFHA
ncbi:MAG: AAA family ATPase [Deltaproteobacteria bacterium]|nr:AAA family ATPase [Deltaproteobacteria bacterium]